MRTSGTLLPWQYYQISFKVVNDYKIFKLPINEFKRSSVFLSKQINPGIAETTITRLQEINLKKESMINPIEIEKRINDGTDKMFNDLESITSAVE